jgi:hypothetical protein
MNIKANQIFPLIMIVMDLGAAIVCLSGGDWKRALYWCAAALLTWSITF